MSDMMDPGSHNDPAGREPGVGPGEANDVTEHLSGLAGEASPLTPGVESALEALDVPIPQEIGEVRGPPGAEELVLTSRADQEPRWLIPSGPQEVPEEIAKQAIEAGCTVINSDADLRDYVEARGYALVPLTELDRIQITESGPRITMTDYRGVGQSQIEKLANFLMEHFADRITDGGAGDVAIDILTDLLPQAGCDTVETPVPKGVNPKDLVGAKKPDLSLVPPAGLLYEAQGMMDGARKYGPYNWRENPVQLRVYVAAAMRHLMQYLDGEDFDPVSGVHHLGHARCCLGILADARETGNLQDDRPLPGPAGGMIRHFEAEKSFDGR